MRCLLIGREALDRHDWATARAAYQEAVRRAPSGESFEGLAVALFWLNDADAAFQAIGRAYERYRREGPPGRAALAALWLAGQYLRIRGNASAARGMGFPVREAARRRRALSGGRPGASRSCRRRRRLDEDRGRRRARDRDRL